VKTSELAVALPLLSRGWETFLLLTALGMVMLAVFGAGYWHFIRRNHQADGPTDEYADEERYRSG
jgi:hypothetical protein